MQFNFNRYMGRTNMPPTSGSTLEDLDPAKVVLLDLFEAAISNELGATWANSRLGALEGKPPVSTKIPEEASKAIITNTKLTFPMLFVWRDGDPVHDMYTNGRRRKTQRWGIEWILGAYQPELAPGFSAALHYFSTLVDQICQMGGHPAYPEGNDGEFPFQALFDTSTGCGFTTAEVKSSASGAASFTEENTGPVYHGCRVIIETTEVSGQQDDTLNAYPHEGVDFKFTGDAEGEDQADEDDWSEFDAFVEVQSDAEE